MSRQRYNGQTLGKIFNNSYGQVMEFFVENRDNDYSLFEIERKTKVSYRQLSRIIERFLSLGVIQHTRVVGKKTKMFKLAVTPSTTHLCDFHLLTKKIIGGSSSQGENEK